MHDRSAKASPPAMPAARSPHRAAGAMRRRALRLALPLAGLILWQGGDPARGEGAEGACPGKAVRVAAGESIQRAAIRAGEGGTICIGAGLYRMQEIAPLRGQTFLGEPGSVLDGSRIVRQFERAGPYWSLTGSYPRHAGAGQCRGGGSLCLLSLAVFLDGQPLTRVASRGDLGPGRYVVEAAAGRAILADNPEGRRVEVSAARFAFRSRAADVRIKGLVVEKYDTPTQMGAIRGGDGTGWRVEDSQIRLNAGLGVDVGSDGAITGSTIERNGQLGAAAQGRRILIENNRIAWNNTAGFDPEWEAGGLKITQSQEVVLRGNHVHDNAGPGLWCDIDCRDVLFEKNTVENNSTAGIFFEISYDAVIRGNTLRFNGAGHPVWFWGADIQVAASSGVEVSDNTITVRPDGRAIVLVDQGREKDGGGFYRTTGNRVHDNRIVFTGRGSAGGVTDTNEAAPNARIIEEGGNSFDRNTYAAPADVKPVFIWGRTPIDYAGFREAGQEKLGRLVTRTAPP
ncbi:right-handed parallel beta-helix repeat-containing protein [Methylobacterium bullatum]